MTQSPATHPATRRFTAASFARIYWPLLSAAMLASCAPSRPEPRPALPAPAPVAAPSPQAGPAAEVNENWPDQPQTPGSWSYRLSAGGVSEANFTTADGRQIFTLLCSPRQEIAIIRNGNGSAPMQIYTETATRSLPMSAGQGRSVTTLASRDPLLDAMALSRGRFAVEVGGLEPLYLPAWAEVTRVIEDCR